MSTTAARTTLLCVVPDCANPNTGTPDTPADGLLICNHHHRWATRHLAELPALDADLVTASVRTARPGDNVGYTKNGQTSAATGIVLDENVIAAKDGLRESLHLIVAFVTTERGTTPPAVGDTATVCAWIARHADWLSANPVAAPWWPVTVRGARDTARAHAYPTAPDGVLLGHCPQPPDDTDIPCGAPVRYAPSDYTGHATATCRACGTTRTVAEWEQVMLGGDDANLEGALYTAGQLVRCIAVRQGRVVSEATIRKWVERGRITPQGRDHRGRTLYDPLEVLRVVSDAA